jgi:hypothetical protein
MNTADSIYGNCTICGGALEPVWFLEPEYKTFQGQLFKTGRKRMAVNYLQCMCCLKKESVDDDFCAGPWQ